LKEKGMATFLDFCLLRYLSIPTTSFCPQDCYAVIKAEGQDVTYAHISAVVILWYSGGIPYSSKACTSTPFASLKKVLNATQSRSVRTMQSFHIPVCS